MLILKIIIFWFAGTCAIVTMYERSNTIKGWFLDWMFLFTLPVLLPLNWLWTKARGRSIFE